MDNETIDTNVQTETRERKDFNSNAGFFILAVILILLAIFTIKRVDADVEFMNTELEFWQETTAEVLSAELKSYYYDRTRTSHNIEFAYDLRFYTEEGEEIIITRITQGSGRHDLSDEEKIPQYTVGEILPITYNPETPWDSTNYYLNTKDGVYKSIREDPSKIIAQVMFVVGVLIIIADIVFTVKKIIYNKGIKGR
jgi:hypothetical protein